MIRVTLSLLSVTTFNGISGGVQKRDQMARNEVDIYLKTWQAMNPPARADVVA